MSLAKPLPFYEKVENNAEENIEEDDEDARKKNEMDLLKQKLANGEELS